MNERVMYVSVDEQGILHTTLEGNIPTERIPTLQQDISTAKDVIQEEYHKRGLKFKSLINLAKFGGTYEPRALSLLAEYMKENKPFIAKSAAYGGGATTTLAGNIVATLAGRDNLAFFKTEAEAREWLRV